MSNKIRINPARLVWCCEQEQIEPGDLHKHVKIAETTLARGLAGDSSLSIRQLETIAKFFDYGLLFFLDEKPVTEEKIHSPQFRTINGKRPDLRKDISSFIRKVERQREIYLGLSENLQQETAESWFPQTLLLNPGNLKESAASVREWFNIQENRNFRALRNQLEEKGIFTIVSSGYKGQWNMGKENPVRGFCLNYESSPVIAIKKQSEGAQAFTLIHELAHLLFHRDCFIDDSSNLSFNENDNNEVFANRFAGLVLVPDEFLTQINIEELRRKRIKDYDSYLRRYCKTWCVSPEVILRRLLDEKLLSRDIYRRYRDYKKNESSAKSGGGKRLRFREPINIFGRKYVNTVLDALNNQHITLNKASTYLDNLKITDLHQLERHVLHS